MGISLYAWIRTRIVLSGILIPRKNIVNSLERLFVKWNWGSTHGRGTSHLSQAPFVLKLPLELIVVRGWTSRNTCVYILLSKLY